MIVDNSYIYQISVAKCQRFGIYLFKSIHMLILTANIDKCDIIEKVAT